AEEGAARPSAAGLHQQPEPRQVAGRRDEAGKRLRLLARRSRSRPQRRRHRRTLTPGAVAHAYGAEELFGAVLGEGTAGGPFDHGLDQVIGSRVVVPGGAGVRLELQVVVEAARHGQQVAEGDAGLRFWRGVRPALAEIAADGGLDVDELFL